VTRVVHVHRIAGIGGSERHLLTLLPALRARGVDAVFVGLDVKNTAPDPFYDELERNGVPFVRVRSAWRLVRAVRRLRPDIVHTHLVHADAFGTIAALGTRAVLVSTKHNDDPFRVGPYRHVERLLTRRASRVICITGALDRFNRERVGLPAGKLTVVHYGLDALPQPWAGGVDEPLPPDETTVLLAVSRLTEQKGLDVAVRAVAQLEAPAVLVVLGEGPDRERLAALASELGVDLRLPGRVGDVAAWYRRADLLVHPARWEGFGLALLEAMLAGLPVVASRVSAIPEIVVHGETGLLVPPDDAGALSDAIRQILREPGELGAAGLRRAHEEFSVATMADRTLAVYRASDTTASAQLSTE
jgi:glycosyltransferase involved in cell wall biosynthesis